MAKFNLKQYLTFQEDMADLYVSNGTGRISFTNVVSSTQNTDELDFSVRYNGRTIGPSDGMFYIIGAQISRNNISREDSKNWAIGTALYLIRWQIFCIITLQMLLI